MWSKVIVRFFSLADTLYFWMNGDFEKEESTHGEPNLDQEFASNSLNEQETVQQLEDEGLTLCVGCQQEFIAHENGSTGYQWIINTEDCSKEVVGFETSFDYQCDDESDGGCGGERSFTFTGVGQGQCTYKMAYMHPWEFDWDDEDSIQQAKDEEGYIEFEIFVV